MRIILVAASLNNAAKWDEYVAKHPMASPYHRFAWLQTVEQAYGYSSAAQLACVDDKVVGVLPCSKMHIPLSGHKYCSLPYCDLGHYLADNEQVSELFNTHLQQIAEKAGLEYRASAKPLDLTGDTSQFSGAKVRMLLTLPTNSQDLMNGFKSKLRSQIRKAEKNGLTFELGSDSGLVKSFYDVYARNMHKLGSPPHSLQWFQTLKANYAQNMLVSIVRHDEKAVGAGIVLLNANKVCIPWASTLAEFNKLAPNMLLYWSLLAHVTDLGCTEFDFGRSTFNQGTYKFKQQWGALPVMLDWRIPYLQNAPNEQANEAGKPGRIRQIVEKTWPKLPLTMSIWLGSKIRKYISL